MENTKKTILLTSILIASIIMTSLPLAVQAGTATTVTGVETYDSAGNPRTITGGPTNPFYVGEYIFISWSQMPSFGTVDISATDDGSNSLSIYKVSTALTDPVPGVDPESTLWANQGTSAYGCLAIYAADAGVYHITISCAGAPVTLDVTIKDPSITVTPDLKASGTTVTITGSDFQATSTITVTFDGSSVTLTPATVTTDSNGDFSATFTIPSLPDGPYTVIATDSGSHSASTTYNISSIIVTPENPVGMVASLAAVGLAFAVFMRLKHAKTAAKPSIPL